MTTHTHTLYYCYIVFIISPIISLNKQSNKHSSVHSSSQCSGKRLLNFLRDNILMSAPPDTLLQLPIIFLFVCRTAKLFYSFFSLFSIDTKKQNNKVLSLYWLFVLIWLDFPREKKNFFHFHCYTTYVLPLVLSYCCWIIA